VWAAAFPTDGVPDIGTGIITGVNTATDWVQANLFGVTNGIRNAVSYGLLNPLQALLADGPWYLTGAAIVSLALLLVVFELIRSRRLRERYALLWLATGLVLVVLSAWRGGLTTIAGWFGVRGYPPAVLFAVGLLFVILVLLHYSTVISRLADQNTILAQRLALLEAKFRDRE
jgi:hypothetical protein